MFFAFLPLFHCSGVGKRNFDLSNDKPLDELRRFDTFKAADFLVEVTRAEGDKAYVADTGSGRVYSFPKKTKGSPGEVCSSAQSGVYGGQVTFSPSENQRYGFDKPAEGKEKPREYFKLDKSRNSVAWKSLKAGSPDYVQMNAEGDLDPDSLRYIRDSGMPVPASPGGGDKTARTLLLNGGMDGDREMLAVARSNRSEDNDTTEKLPLRGPGEAREGKIRSIDW